ncbi:hypothetical protein [Pedobacter aquatilis]|uniref:hypothetical protein n=1 Tax=Pedobacter aquatilis TaxID=351343 RepID=UPI0029313C42|nr:hypothetical protein [Pedobacter aquatilis]
MNKLSTNFISKKHKRFQDTCPYLLNDEYLENPYLEIESFFSAFSLGEYKRDLKKWFKAVLTEKNRFKNTGALIFFYEQLIRLIHASYVIAQSDLKYPRDKPYSHKADSFGSWILFTHEANESLSINTDVAYVITELNTKDKANPMRYLRTHLTFKKVKWIRYGLKEWLQIGLSKKSSIVDADERIIYPLYEQLEKLLEICFLLLMLVSQTNAGLDFPSETD